MFGEIKIRSYKLLLKKTLSKKRYHHSLNVANEAMKLAEKHNADLNKAYLAGLLHDICKEMPLEEQQKFVKNSSLDVSEVELNSKSLWHGIAGAEYVKQNLNIKDDDIINSIRYHTVARANMSLLEKIVYLADLVSIDRKYKTVKKMRKLCYKNLDNAMLEALRFSIIQSISKENTIPLSTLEAYNQHNK